MSASSKKKLRNAQNAEKLTEKHHYKDESVGSVCIVAAHNKMHKTAFFTRAEKTC